MAWVTTTIWINNKIKNFEDAVDLIMRDNEEFNSGGVISYKNLKKNKIFDDTKTGIFNNRTIKYNYIDFSIDSIIPGDEIEEARTTKINGFILIYEFGNSIKYLINRNYDALRLLRLLCGYEDRYDGRGEITGDNINMSSDMFMWFVKSVYNEQNLFSFSQEDQTEKNLEIESILGVRSETRDENKLSAQGNTVMNLISTLSFILESDEIKQLILRLTYASHEVIEIKLTSKGVVSCEIDCYSGDYENLSKSRLTCNLLLLVNLEIIPNLKQVFYTDMDSGNWTDKKKDFFQDIEKELMHRLEERRKDL